MDMETTDMETQELPLGNHTLPLEFLPEPDSPLQRAYKLLLLLPPVAAFWCWLLIISYNQELYQLPLRMEHWHLIAISATFFTLLLIARLAPQLPSAGLLLMVDGILLLVAIQVPNYIRARAPGCLTACKSNLKNIATACEMYASDNHGDYPSRLTQLVPGYLKVLPKCPTADSDTYSRSYQRSADPQNFTFCCSGNNHCSAGIREANFPQYSSKDGLIERQ